MRKLKKIWFFHTGNKASQEIEEKLNEASKAIEGKGYDVITIHSSTAEQPTLMVDDHTYPLIDHWINLFIDNCQKSFAIA